MGDGFYYTKNERETAILVGVGEKGQPDKISEYLDELTFLAETAGAETKKRFVQRLDHPDPKTYVGKGKMEEIEEYVKANEIDIAIFDDELSPSQIRNLEEVLQCKILDRSGLILDIFARNAKTAQARTQVELAQMEYMLPRLTRMWTHLQKQKGGIGMKGPGEKEIETDRRIIRDRIAKLKKDLDGIDRQSVSRRKNRKDVVRVALVGYTNVGKSTILNLIAKAEVKAENKLFATLDSTVRKVVWPPTEHHYEPIVFLLSDTVGFIRKLPHQLVESFKSTLDEVIEADILIHVVDVSHPQFEDHMNVVKETLTDIGAGDKPVLTVFNKTDLYSPEPTSDDIFEDETIYDIATLKETWMAREPGEVVFISATEKSNIDEFVEFLKKMVNKQNEDRNG